MRYLLELPDSEDDPRLQLVKACISSSRSPNTTDALLAPVLTAQPMYCVWCLEAMVNTNINYVTVIELRNPIREGEKYASTWHHNVKSGGRDFDDLPGLLTRLRAQFAPHGLDPAATVHFYDATYCPVPMYGAVIKRGEVMCVQHATFDAELLKQRAEWERR
jgi:hypothetical protein